MNAFFSAEDIDELHTNVANYSKNGSYYLSLIVNMKEEYVAKIVKLVDVPSTDIVIEEEGEKSSKIQTVSEQEMLMFDLDIEIEGQHDDKDLMERIGELKEAKKKEEEAKKKFKSKKPTTTQVYPKYNNDPYQYWYDEEWNSSGSTDVFGEDTPYQLTTANVKSNLNNILTLDTDNKKETGQILDELNDLNSGAFQIHMDEIEDNAYLMTIDMFGYDKSVQALEMTHKELMSYSKISKWTDITKELGDCLQAALITANYVVE